MKTASAAQRSAPWGVERSLSYARWAGAVVVVVQGTLFEPGPQARPYLTAATFGIAGLFVAANLVLLPALRRKRIPRTLAASMFAVDLGAICALVWLYLDNPNATQWVLFMIIQLEAAYRWEMRGAVGTALFSSSFYALVRFNAAREFGFEFTVDSITYVLGLTMVQGLVVGGMAAKLRSERDASYGLHEAAFALNAGLDRQTILSTLAEEAARLLDATSAVVWLPGEDGFEAGGSSRLPPGFDGSFRLPHTDPVFGESAAATAFREGTAVWAPDPASGRAGIPALEASVLPQTWRSVCAVPIPAEEAPLGVLSCYFARAHRTDPDDASRLQALAALAAVAITNAAAYERERTALENLRSLDRLKDDFLSTVSHELRTPLTVVEGFATTLRERWHELPDDRRRDLVERIEAQARQLHERIRDVLDFSRLQSGALALHPERGPIAAIVAETVSRLEPNLSPHPVHVTVPDDLEAWFDAAALDQILENLLVNAARYSPPEAPISVRADRVGDGWVELAVVDRGIGIPLDEQNHIFERFYRGRQDEVRRIRGTGIGLAIVQQLATALGGSVEVESEPGEGSTFVVRLPASADLAADVLSELGQPSMDDPASTGHPS